MRGNQPARGNTMRTRTITSSATTDGSAHWPSPMLNARRLIVNSPVATELPAASFLTSIGIFSSCTVPFNVSFPLNLVAVAAQVLHRRGLERRNRKFRGIEPARAPDFRFRFLAGQIDAGKVDLELGLGFREVLGPEVDIGLPLAEAALDIDAHLPGNEADLALVDEHGLRAGGGGGHQQHGQRRDEGTKETHVRDFRGSCRVDATVSGREACGPGRRHGRRNDASDAAATWIETTVASSVVQRSVQDEQDFGGFPVLRDQVRQRHESQVDDGNAGRGAVDPAGQSGWPASAHRARRARHGTPGPAMRASPAAAAAPDARRATRAARR